MEKQHEGGSVVTFVNRGVRVNALVVQSEITNLLDKTIPEGVRQEEHLTVVFLKPELLQSRMGGADVARAIGTEYGVLAVAEAPDDPNNLLRYALVGATDDQTVIDLHASIPVGENLHPELVQYSPVHAAQVPAIRSREPLGKIPAETSYRETEKAPVAAAGTATPHTVPAAEWDSWTPEAKDEYLKQHPDTVVEEQHQQ